MNDHQRRVLAALQQNDNERDVSASALADTLGVASIHVRRALSALVTRGLVERQIDPGHPTTYGLTWDGRLLDAS